MVLVISIFSYTLKSEKEFIFALIRYTKVSIMKLPNIPAKAFSLSAVIVGYLLIDDLTSNEQNALGNWLMLTAQVLCTNAFYQQVQAERNQDNVNNNMTTEDTINIMEKMIHAMEEELSALRKAKN